MAHCRTRIALLVLFAVFLSQKVQAATVVSVDKREVISDSELKQNFDLLPESRKRRVQNEAQFETFLNVVIDNELFALEAKRLKLDKNKRYKDRVEVLKKRLLLEELMKQEVEGKLTDAYLKKMYKKKRTMLQDDQVKAKTEAKELASKVRKGEKFAELAKKHSIGPTGKRGGELGWFRRWKMVPAFSKAAFNAKKGAVVGPVKTRFGWHVIWVQDRKKGKVLPFKKVRVRLRREAQKELQTALRERVRNGKKIKIHESALAKARKALLPKKD
jgi:peptidyl-prolyl cis-trans isomerase C